MICLSALFWAYVIGSFCSIIATSDVFGIEFKQRMDELNHMMAEHHFDSALRRRCRMFYIESKQTKRVLNYRKLECEMSLQMRGEVAVANNRAWMAKVWFFSEANEAFIVEISQLLVPSTFAPVSACATPHSCFG